ncbi:energy-coupling factor ABC transporter ATP-binding protein [Rossellomorea sp. SC111]|uniref:ABC transporter ATP-binding protein n=1 Tax=Rossellomorea sp. SC111 TaxID=2968985 RepID=UPI00215B3F05|nr:energy-coupling factor ABC transporter ATP-binding protein [Rossellomorea sp. SC111]MCR8847323.1 energy-coupling factor ABC transporter ATP-binding protein [Rossellomorea sp. SC111]
MHVEDLRLTFPGSEKRMFNDVSLSINEGEKVLLLGPSGCGKSTLLHVLSGVIPRSVDVPMRAESIDVSDSFGYVFQDPDSQFCMPFVDEELAFVLENLRTPREEMKGEIRRLLSEVGLELDDPHTEISTLSGGMKQKLAIASALALRPDTLFLDEPTSLLDEGSTKSVWKTLKEICLDKTLVIVEHKLDHVLNIIDRIILFDSNGTIMADGAKEWILKHYKETLKTLGVWYPGAWEEYLSSRQMREIPSFGPVIARMEHFKGFIQKNEKIHLPHASIRKGEWIAITGRNGAGKSTLLHSLMKFIYTSGTYEINGIQMKGKKIPQECAFVFQNPELQFVTHTVYDESAYSYRLKNLNEESVERNVHELLQRFNLCSFKEHHPYSLSLGQKRRLSVAASIVPKKEILLLDEPTFGQDAHNTFELIEMLLELQREGVTILMVTHDVSIIQHFATRIWTIEKGRLVQDVDVEVVRSEAL